MCLEVLILVSFAWRRDTAFMTSLVHFGPVSPVQDLPCQSYYYLERAETAGTEIFVHEDAMTK